MRKRLLATVLMLCMLLGGGMLPAQAVEATVTRGEWISGLVQTFSMTVEAEATLPDNYFSDMTAEMGCYQDVLLAVEFGVIRLEAGEAFMPDAAATRAFAAETLNFCLNFSLGDNPEYTFAEAEETENPEALQVAINRGWFALSGEKVVPGQTVTKTEADKMLADAKKIIDASVIDENYESTYTFAEGVIVIPKTATVTIDKNYTVTASEYDNTIKKGDLFVAYSGNIPVALKATGVSVKDGVTTISATPEGAEEAITAADSQGVMEIDMESFEAEEAELFSVTDTVTNETENLEVSLQGISYDKKTKTLKASHSIKLGSGTAGSVSVELSDLKLYHSESTGSGRYTAYITANTTVTKSISFDFGNYLGLPNSLTLGKINIGGIGNITLTVNISLKGGMTETEDGVLMAGFEYVRNDGFRLIKGYQKTNYSFVAEAEVDIGLTLALSIDLVLVEGRVWATVGVKGKYTFKHYDSGSPSLCETISAYLYANVGASVTINYIIDKNTYSKTQDIFTKDNSPVRVYYHYENSVMVDECTRGKTNNETYTKYTTKSTSSYFNPAPSYAQSSYTNTSTDSNGATTTTTTTLWTYTVDSNNNATITGYKGSSSAVAIPSKIDGYTVTEIGGNAFKNNTRLRSVTIPDSVTEIGNYAFENCTNLSNVTMSKYLETLGSHAFYGCTSLKSIEIPKTLSSAGYYGAFTDCSSLKTVLFGEGIINIPSRLFMNCTGLESISIPDSVTKIGEAAFYECTNLKSVTIADSVMKIETDAFGKCTNLSSVTMSKYLETLGSNAFYGCTSLKSIEIPKTLSSAGYYGAFADCSSLKTVLFGEGIINIPSCLFKNCTGLESISIPDSVTKVGISCFSGCTSLTDVTLSKSISALSDDLFSGCTSLKSFTVPNYITEMGTNIFIGCTALETVEFLNIYSGIPSDTFYDCSSLKKIVFPGNVKTIGDGAFMNCTALEEITLPGTLETIGSSAFNGCKVLKEITTPGNVKSIDGRAFYNCDKLEKAEIQSFTSMGSDAFNDCDALKTVMVNGQGALPSKAFYDCDALTSITIGDGVTSIGSNMCYSCDVLTDIKMGKGITTISDSAFRQCQSLTTVTIPRFCKTIEEYAFAENVKLTSAYVPVSVESIQNNSFSYPAKMTMYGKSGSYAAEYASGRGMTFSAVNAPITNLAYSGTLKMKRYDTVMPALSITPAFDTDTVTFTSSDTSIATVSETGAVYAKNYGTATITALTGTGRRTTLSVSIVKPAESVAISTSTMTLGMGESGSLRATLSPSNTGDSVKWTTSNSRVATVDSAGRVTAVGEGVATITAASMYGTQTASCSVLVKYKTAVTGFTVTPSGNTLIVRIAATELPADAFVYVATYTKSGKMLDLRRAELVDGTAEATIPKTDAALLKTFLWRGRGMGALVKAKEYTITN